MMDDMQSFMSEDIEHESNSLVQSLIERNETSLGPNIPSFALGEVDNISLADEEHFPPNMNATSGDTKAIDKKDCDGQSWWNTKDLPLSQQQNEPKDDESLEDLHSIVSSGDIQTSDSGRSRFSERIGKSPTR